MSPCVAVTVALPEATSWLMSSGAVTDSEAMPTRLLVRVAPVGAASAPPAAASRTRRSRDSIPQSLARFMAPSSARGGPPSYRAAAGQTRLTDTDLRPQHV